MCIRDRRLDLQVWLQKWACDAAAAQGTWRPATAEAVEDVAAALAIQDVTGAMPKQLVRSFGQWLRQHVRIRLKNGVLNWQWALVASC
eukprot:7589023-Lingulodinium_polyedra.AAC.1